MRHRRSRVHTMPGVLPDSSGGSTQKYAAIAQKNARPPAKTVALNVLAIRQYRGDNEAYLTLFLLMNGGYILALLFACVRALMHRPLFYERLSGTRLESTTENMNQ